MQGQRPTADRGPLCVGLHASPRVYIQSSSETAESAARFVSHLNVRGRGTFHESRNKQDSGEMDFQLEADKEDQDRAQRGENEAGGMISLVLRAKNHVGNTAAEERSDDAEHDCPEHRKVLVHHRFREKTRAQTDQNVPEYVKHAFSSI